MDMSLENTDNTQTPTTTDVVFRVPTAADGLRMWEIARDSKVLDLNSEYAYVLWGQEFAESSVVVESDGGVVGFVTGFIRPGEPETIFVWQVGVDSNQRGKGLAKRMLHEIMDRLAPTGVVQLRTTVSPDNEASKRTFGALARERGLALTREDFISAELLGEGHEPEDLYTVA